MTGQMSLVPLLTGRVMPLNEIPKYFNTETRHLVDAALEDAWQELKKDGLVDADPARMKLATTIVALASVGETDPGKLKEFALHAAQAALKATRAKAKAAAL
jgi:hypothetical protein